MSNTGGGKHMTCMITNEVPNGKNIGWSWSTKATVLACFSSFIVCVNFGKQLIYVGLVFLLVSAKWNSVPCLLLMEVV